MSVLTRSLAREARLIGAAFRRGARGSGEQWGSGKVLRPLLMAVCCIATLELVVLHVLLLAIVESVTWVWLLAALELYAVLWLIGLLRGFRSWPHVIDDDQVTLRVSAFDEVVVARDAILGARVKPERPSGRRLRPDADGHAHFVMGEADVELDIADGGLAGRGDAGTSVTTLAIAVDDPRGFVAAVGPGASDVVGGDVHPRGDA